MSTPYNNNNTQILTFQTRNGTTRDVERESRNQFTNPVNKEDNPNQNCSLDDDTISRIKNMEPQRGNNFFEETFFNGTDFEDHNSVEYLILTPFARFP